MSSLDPQPNPKFSSSQDIVLEVRQYEGETYRRRLTQGGDRGDSSELDVAEPFLIGEESGKYLCACGSPNFKLRLDDDEGIPGLLITCAQCGSVERHHVAVY